MAAVNIANWVFLLTVLVASVQLGESLKCYLCSTNDNEYCGDNFDASKAFQVECSPESDICFKAVETIGDERLAFRNCWTKDVCKLGFEFCEECGTDLCNSGPVSKM